jgi:hypothetical protein
MGKKLLSAYEIAKTRDISSTYAERRKAIELACDKVVPSAPSVYSEYLKGKDAIRKREQEAIEREEQEEIAEQEEMNALPDFVDSWQRPDKGESTETPMISDDDENQSRFYTQAEIKAHQNNQVL